MRIRRLLLIGAFIASMVQLASCGKPFDPEAVRSHYAGDFAVEYTVETHAGFCTSYQLSAVEENGVATVLVRKPESVSGITATLGTNRPQMGVGEIMLDALLPERSGYAPVDVMYELLRDLRGRDPDTYCMENGHLVLEYQTDFPEGYEGIKRVTMQKDRLDLLSAELFLDGGLILSVQVQSIEQRFDNK